MRDFGLGFEGGGGKLKAIFPAGFGLPSVAAGSLLGTPDSWLGRSFSVLLCFGEGWSPVLVKTAGFRCP